MGTNCILKEKYCTKLFAMCKLGSIFALNLQKCAMERNPSFNFLIEQSIIKNWDQDALTDYKGATLQFHDVARKIEKLHIVFENSGLLWPSIP